MSEKEGNLENVLELPSSGVDRRKNPAAQKFAGSIASIHDSIIDRLHNMPLTAFENEDDQLLPNWNQPYIDLFTNANVARNNNDHKGAYRYFEQAQILVKKAKRDGENTRQIPIRDISTSYMKIMCLNAAQLNPKKVVKELHDMSFSINEYLFETIEFFPNVKETELYKNHVMHITQKGFVNMENLSGLVDLLHQSVLMEFLTNLRRYTRSNISLDNKINICLQLIMGNEVSHEFLRKKLEEILTAVNSQHSFSIESSYPFSSLFEIIERIWTLHFFITRYGTMHNQFYAKCSFNLKKAGETTPIVQKAAANAQITKLLLPHSYVIKDPLQIRKFLSTQTSNWLITENDVHALLENLYETGDSEQRKIIFSDKVKRQLEQLLFLYINDPESGIHQVDFENAVEKLATYHFAVAWSDLSKFTTSYNELETLLAFKQVDECPKNILLINILKCRLALRAAMMRENKLFEDTQLTFASRRLNTDTINGDDEITLELPEYADTLILNNNPVSENKYSFNNDESSTVPTDRSRTMIHFADQVPDIQGLYDAAYEAFIQLNKISPEVVNGDAIHANYADIISARINLLRYEKSDTKDIGLLNKIITRFHNAVKPDGQIERRKSAYQIQEAEKYFIIGLTYVKLASHIFNSINKDKTNTEFTLENVFRNIELAETCICEANGIINQLDYKDEQLIFEMEKAYKELIDVHLMASGVPEHKRGEIIQRIDMSKILGSFNIQKWGKALKEIINMSHNDPNGQYQSEVGKLFESVIMHEAPCITRCAICHRPNSKESNLIRADLSPAIKKLYLEAVKEKRMNENNENITQKYGVNIEDAGIVYVFKINDSYDMVIDSTYEISDTTKAFIEELLKSIHSLFTIHAIRRAHHEGDINFVFEDSVALMEHTKTLAHQLHMPHYPSVKHQVEVGEIAETFFDKYWNKYFPKNEIDPYIARLEAELHDFGKSTINPRLIWEKEASLNKAERSIIEKHPELGAGLCVKIMGAICAENIAVMYAHHTNYGIGYSYPFSCKGAQGYHIPGVLSSFILNSLPDEDWEPEHSEFDYKSYLRCRMLPIFDQAQAISDSDRVYRKPESFENIIAFLKTLAGKDFDPRLVYLFIDAANEGLFDEYFIRDEFEKNAKTFLENNYCYLTQKEIKKIIHYISKNQLKIKKLMAENVFKTHDDEEIDLSIFSDPNNEVTDKEKYIAAIRLIKNGLQLPEKYKQFEYPQILEFDSILEFLEFKLGKIESNEKDAIQNKAIQSVVKIMKASRNIGLYMSVECLHSIFRGEVVQALKPIFASIVLPEQKPFETWKEMEQLDPERYQVAMRKYSRLFIQQPQINRDRKSYLEKLELNSPDEYFKLLKQYAENNYYHFIDELMNELRTWCELKGIAVLTREQILLNPTDRKM